MHLDRDMREVREPGEQCLVVIRLTGLVAHDRHHRGQVLRADPSEVKIDHTVVSIGLDGLSDLPLSLGCDFRV